MNLPRRIFVQILMEFIDQKQGQYSYRRRISYQHYKPFVLNTLLDNHGVIK